MEKITTDAIKSIIIGIGISIFIGFVFSNTSYFYDAVEISEKVYKENIGNIDVFKRIIKKEEFNYKAGLISGSLSLLFFMFVFYDKHRKIVFQNKSKIFFEILIKNTHYILSGFSLKGIKEDTSYLFKNVIFNFNGRYSRFDFFWRLLLLILINYKLDYLYQEETSLFLMVLYFIVFIYFSIIIDVKRLQDFNISGWFSIIGNLPLALFYLANIIKWDFLRAFILVGWNIIFGIIIVYNLILLIIPGNSYTNTYGEKPN